MPAKRLLVSLGCLFSVAALVMACSVPPDFDPQWVRLPLIGSAVLSLVLSNSIRRHG